MDILKIIHVSCVLLSFIGFFTRGIWMTRQSSMLNAAWVKRAPHFVDSLLLLSAIGMLFAGSLNPFIQPWLLAKILGLVVYILLGAVGLHYGPTLKIRIIAWALALLSFLYIVMVAVTKSPYLWFDVGLM